MFDYPHAGLRMNSETQLAGSHVSLSAKLLTVQDALGSNDSRKPNSWGPKGMIIIPNLGSDRLKI